MRKRLGVILVALVGCGDSGLRTLTRDDVSGLPAGDATGTAFSGQYLVTSHHAEACRCRKGSCATLTFSPGQTLLVTQTDGNLQLVEEQTSSSTIAGGVDRDGHFWAGTFREQLGDVQYALIDGHFGSGATPSMDAIQEMTVNVQTVSGAAIDCDVRSHWMASFLAPLTAAWTSVSPHPSIPFMALP